MKELERYISIIRNNMSNIETTLKNIEGLIVEAEATGIPVGEIPEVKGKGLLKSLGDGETEVDDTTETEEEIDVALDTLYVRGAFTDTEVLVVSTGVPFKFKISADEEDSVEIDSEVKAYLNKIGFISTSLVDFESDTEVLNLTSSEQLIPILNKVSEKFGYELVISYDWRMEAE